MTDDAIATLAPVLGTRAACAALRRPPASTTGGTGAARPRSGRRRWRSPTGPSRGR